jgi:signal transduction histidine kinase
MQELLRSVGQAKMQLAALLDRLHLEDTSPEAFEVKVALHELQGLLDKLQARHAQLCELMEQSEIDASAHESEVLTRHRRMRSMATQIVIGEEGLRRLLAAELHNGLGQEIALAKMKLSTLRTVAGGEMRAPLSSIEQLVEQADHSLRSITFQISPPSLHDLGLVAALEWLAEDLDQKYGLAVRIEDQGAPVIADERVRVILFRAVRELLINTATHAKVRAATVEVAGLEGLVRVTVEDRGAGFNTVELERHGYGLLGIREQLKFVDGEIRISSSPGQGTKVILTAPAGELAAQPIA